MKHPRAGETYRPREYWSGLHDEADGLGIVGYPTLPLVFNRLVYANAAHAVTHGLEAAGVRIRGRTILDIGSGTGFWVDLWLAQGAAAVAGSDLVPDAVDRLRRRFPGCEFEPADISEQSPFPDRTFDVVTIMSVLHHVTDDDRFRTALVNLSSQVAPGGYLVVLDGIVTRRRWMPEGVVSAHNVARTLPQWQTALEDVDMRIAGIFPTAAFLCDPIDAGSRIAFSAHRFWWRGFTAAIRGRERLAAAIVPPVAALDRAVTGRLATGTGSKLLVLEHSD